MLEGSKEVLGVRVLDLGDAPTKRVGRMSGRSASKALLR